MVEAEATGGGRKAVETIAESGSLNKKPKLAMEEHRVGLKEGGSGLKNIEHGDATAKVELEATGGGCTGGEIGMYMNITSHSNNQPSVVKGNQSMLLKSKKEVGKTRQMVYQFFWIAPPLDLKMSLSSSCKCISASSLTRI